MERIWVGLDWGDQKHAYVVHADDGNFSGTVPADPEGVHAWIAGLGQRYPGARIVVAVEQSRGAIIYALQQYAFVEIVPINPRAASAYRESLYLSGAKDDPVDAELLCRFVKAHPELRRWEPDDELTRRLRLLVEGRRKLVDQRTSTTQALTATLKQYFPQVLSWFGGADSKLARAFLERWPTLTAAASARRDAIEKLVRTHSRKKPEQIDALVANIRSAVTVTDDGAIVDPLSLLAVSYVTLIDALEVAIARHDQQIATSWSAHPDCALFASFPGAGPVMAPRLAVAFGRDRKRFSEAADLQKYSGIAPVIERSGKRTWIHARFRCPKFLKQTFHEFAAASLPFSPWALAYYRQQRDRGSSHHAAVRSLAFRWIRVLHRCWTSGTAYDETSHLDMLRRRNSPVVSRLAA